MDATAIKEIERLALAEAKAWDLHTDTPAALVNGQIISLESLQEGRARFRGVFKTRSIADFAEYVKNNADSSAEGFVDTDTVSATVFINIGTEEAPGHADWRAVLTPKPTAGYAAALALDGKKLSQKEAIDWIEDWHTFLSASIGGEKKPLSAAIDAIRNIKVSTKAESNHVEADNARKRSAMEEVEASSAGGIPSAIVMRVEPYEDLKLRDIILRLSVITGGPAPVIAFRIAQRGAMEEEVAQEFKKTLAQLIGDEVSLVCGTFTP